MQLPDGKHQQGAVHKQLEQVAGGGCCRLQRQRGVLTCRGRHDHRGALRLQGACCSWGHMLGSQRQRLGPAGLLSQEPGKQD